ncbi:MAG: glycosyl transferase [Desulforudis sp.]|jgi:hypothetical protein|nr:MAG: glycosyl transferase [Desulforudis sp.]
MSSYVYVKLPRAGLGNRLFVLAKGIIYSKLHDTPLLVDGLAGFSIGPYLRGEKVKRNYHGYFDIKHNGWCRRKIIYYLFNHVVEPEISNSIDWIHASRLYLFKNIPHWSDLFKDIREYREVVRVNLLNIISKKYLELAAKNETPVVGIHIRMGDFRKLGQSENFAKVGAVRTPLSYFTRLINLIREIHGSALPVTIFSDGFECELSDILSLPQVKLAGRNSDIVDMLLMSKSRLIVTSAGSTFGQWAGFLSDSPVVHHYQHYHAPSRPVDVNRKYFEGVVDIDGDSLPELLVNNIRSINY